MTYTAGQYAKIGVPALGVWRDYSFSEAPEAGPQTRLCFYVRQTADGCFSRWLGSGCVGEPVQVWAPLGHFGLSASDQALLCVAGGSGLAPIKAMLEQAARQGCKRDARLLFGARTRGDLYALDALESVEDAWSGRFRFIPVLSDEPASSGWTGAVGMVTDHLAAQLADLPSFEAYLCGPPQMVDAAAASLRAAGVPEGRIFADRFVSSIEAPESDPPAAPSQPG
jgi:NAD(P)H-flavin reductase